MRCGSGGRQARAGPTQFAAGICAGIQQRNLGQVARAGGSRVGWHRRHSYTV